MEAAGVAPTTQMDEDFWDNCEQDLQGKLRPLLEALQSDFRKLIRVES
jgi:hypothetical protein